MTEDTADTVASKPSRMEGQVTLTQMLKALDKDIAVGVEKKLKKLSKKKALEAPLDDQKAAQAKRIDAYSQVTKEISKWDPIVERNKKAKHISFPLDQEPDQLPSTADCIDSIKPRNDLERDVQAIIDESKAALRQQKELTAAEEKYQKAISIDEAKERHKELQRMRVKLGTYAAKMRRQKTIKSKSYHKLLKSERLKNHMKRVESNQDALLDEIERLQKLRAQERASLKHKNTGKWAKHAKFRAKYDDEARKAMLEQIGIAGKLLEKPAPIESDSEDSDEYEEDDNDEEEEEDQDEDAERANSDDDEMNVKLYEEDLSEISDQSSDDDDDEKGHGAEDKKNLESNLDGTNDRLIVSNELINVRAKKRTRRSSNGNDENDSSSGSESAGQGDQSDEEEEEDQRKLMSEAFANDDVVGEFKRAKDQVADEEQPKDVDNYLPGWGDWAGPGIKVNKRKRKRYIVKAKKIERRDASLGNVIISERANEVIRELQPKQLPRGYKNDHHLRKTLTRPTTSTFVDSTAHRELVRPKIETRMGKRIEPIGSRMLTSGTKAAGWA